jgi:hypothetical protein
MCGHALRVFLLAQIFLHCRLIDEYCRSLRQAEVTTYGVGIVHQLFVHHRNKTILAEPVVTQGKHYQVVSFVLDACRQTSPLTRDSRLLDSADRNRMLFAICG